MLKATVDARAAIQDIVLAEINVLFRGKAIPSVNNLTLVEFVPHALMDIFITGTEISVSPLIHFVELQI